MERKRVVITGISAISGNSNTKDCLFKNLLEGTIFVASVPDCFEKNYTFRSRFFVPFPKINIGDYGFHNKLNLLMEENVKIGIVCTKEALLDAGFQLKENNKTGFQIEENESPGIIIGVGISSLKTAFTSYVQHAAHHLQNEELKDYRYNRMVIPLTMPNSVAAWISIIFGTSDQCHTINASCASGNHAIGEAFGKIKNGESKFMITGGVECLMDEFGAMMRGFDMLGALTLSKNGQPESFSENRSGFLFSEGAGCILILEEMEHALARGAQIYAEITDCFFNSDHHNILQMEESGMQIKKLLRQASENKKIDYLNAHGTATTNNDSIEAAAIKEIFGSVKNQPLINSTKSILGHSIGASAAIEAAVTAISIKQQCVHLNLSENNIEGLNIINKSCSADINYALSTSYGFGGHNSAVLFKKFV